MSGQYEHGSGGRLLSPGDAVHFTIAGLTAIHDFKVPSALHPGGNPGANLKSITHRCYLILVAFVWELTKETIYLPLGYLKGGPSHPGPRMLSAHLSALELLP